MATADSRMPQSIERSAGTTGSLRGARPRRGWMLAVSCLCLAVLMMSAAGHAESHSRSTAKYWKGKNIAEATKKFGDPTQATPLQETGGNLYIFAHQGEQHWVFETNNIGVIVKAAKVE
jgi:hypothetical protein